MDGGSVDEMLFGFMPCDDFPSSQDSLAESWNDDSEIDDMLDSVSPLDNPSSWALQGSPTLDIRNQNLITTNNLQPSQERVQPSGFASPSVPLIKDRDWVIAHIESMLEDIVDTLIDGKRQLSIALRTRSGTSGRKFDTTKGIIPITSQLKTKTITFPGNTPQEAWRFTVLVRILEFVHSALIDNVVGTKRDIYYRHPDLFVNQSVVDRYVDDLACTLGVSRTSLHVTAAAKGLLAGNFSIRRTDGTVINGLSDREGLLVPKLLNGDIVDLSKVDWILIIEKEATFRSLLSSAQWPEIGAKGIALTAKGYPDLASRTFLSQLVDQSPNLVLYALVDFDPDGLAIMSTYKHGSYALAHENVTARRTGARGGTLNLSQIQWLGLKSYQLNQQPATECGTCEDTLIDSAGLMKLTTRDRKKARQMLSWEVFAEQGPEPEWQREIQTMLMLNVKAEMQVLDERSGGIAGWLRWELGVAQSDHEMDMGANRSVPPTGPDDEFLL